MDDEARTMAELPESLSVFDSESDAEGSEEESQSECFVELNTFDPSQATLIQVITDCKEEAIVKTSSRGPAVLELLESLQNNIERRECKELSDKLSKSMLECVSGLVSQARPLPPAAFSSFRINTRREGLGDCLCQSGSG